MKIELNWIKNGWIVTIDEGMFSNQQVFFKTRGQAVAYVKRRLNSWNKNA